MMQSVPQKEPEGAVKKIVERHVCAGILEFGKKNEEKGKEFSLIERVVRVEEELRFLRQMSEKRFDMLHIGMDVRFSALDKRLSQVQWFGGIWLGLVTLLGGVIKFVR
jgi:hypothetical protein